MINNTNPFFIPTADVEPISKANATMYIDENLKDTYEMIIKRLLEGKTESEGARGMSHQHRVSAVFLFSMTQLFIHNPQYGTCSFEPTYVINDEKRKGPITHR